MDQFARDTANSANVLAQAAFNQANTGSGIQSYANSNVVSLLSSFGSNNITTTGNVNTGKITTTGSTNTGANAVIAGVTNTLLSNTIAGFSANVNSYTQVTFQNKSTGTDATADYILTADNGNDTTNYGDFGIINSGYDNSTPTNSLGNIVFAADTYLYAQGNTNNTNQSGGNLVIGTATTGKSVKIFAGGNTANALVVNVSGSGVGVTGNITASGTITTNNIVGTSANVTITAGSYVSTFDTSGTATFPGDVVGNKFISTNSVGNEGGEIQLAASANATITNGVIIDSYNDIVRIFEGGGSARGVRIDIAKAPAGVGGELLWKVGGVVDAGTFVTLDNLNVTIPTSNNRGLSVAAVSGSFFANIGAWYGGSGGTGGSSVNNLSVTTTPSVSLFDWNFVAEGNSAQYTIYDKTNNRMYRVTLMIGPAYLNNFISIERLA
jgi:hypothetical protein